MTDLESKCDMVYGLFGDLPSSYPKEYKVWHSKHTEGYSSKILVNKSNESAKEIWAKLNLYYSKFPEMELSKENKFKSHLWNNLFSKKYYIIDKENNRKTTAYIPWYSFLLRPFLRGHIIIMKSKENYYKEAKDNAEDYAMAA
jgi:hypothetical protein